MTYMHRRKRLSKKDLYGSLSLSHQRQVDMISSSELPVSESCNHWEEKVIKLAGFIILLVFMLFLKPGTASATDEISLESWCIGHGRSWDSNTCTVSSFAIVISTQTLAINVAETLNINLFSGNIWNEGTIDNHGTISNFWTIKNVGTLNNHGTIYNQSSVGVIYNHGVINNHGTIVNDLRINNYDTINNYCSGIFSGSGLDPSPNAVIDLCTSVNVAIDIKPGSSSIEINCNASKQVITVAILTTDDFDANTVDHTTVTFEGAPETHVDRRGEVPRRHEEDVDGDEDIDLVFHFRLGETLLTCDSTQAILTGDTYDGISIEGVVNIRSVS